MPKLKDDEKKKFLLEKLEEQRHLISKSINEFASGDLAEGVRLATATRVLIHETSASKPLLAQLTPNYLQLEILDSNPEHQDENHPPGVRKAVVMVVPISIQISDEGVFLNPKLGTGARSISILGRWWNRPALVLPGLGGFSRKEIILGLSNKEGGAHVDVNLPLRYQQLLASQQLQIGWNKEGVTPLNLSRFMAAQSAVEFLDCLNRNFPKADE